mmetsp:Transcript_111252/g.202321  ORF Transcript_111252/g.202321 Transcript_111252/m.202321 type:complete len:472 (+) Transcript_111252:49-1464(+)
MGNACALENDDVMPLRAARLRAPVHEQGARAQTPGSLGAFYQEKDRQELDSQDLFDAAMAGDARRTKWALQAHADPNAATEPVGLRALHLCAAQNHVKAARILVEYEADVAAVDNHLGLSALSMACLGGHPEAVRLLVTSGALLDGPEGDGGAPLLHAARKNFAEVCEVLVNSGADVNAAFRKSEDPYRISAALHCRNATGSWRQVLYGISRVPVDVLFVEGISALHLAAAHGSLRICGCLLEAGARANAVDVLQRSALMLAAEKGHTETVRLLLESSATVCVDVEAYSAGTLAVRSGHVYVVEVLLDYNAMNIHAIPQLGGAAMIHVAVHNGQGGCTSALCDRGADVNMPLQPGGIRPLMLAAAKGYTVICKELLAYAACVNDTDDEGKTAWMHAAAAGHTAVCIMLAHQGAGELAQRKEFLVDAVKATDVRRQRVARENYAMPNLSGIQFAVGQPAYQTMSQQGEFYRA